MFSNETMKKNTKFAENPSLMRTKSLIKPPPPRSSWELLLEDYLKDPSPNSTFTPEVSPKTDFLSSSSPILLESSIPSPYPPSTTEKKSILSARRYQITLDELVYLISQVGRADLYREMVQYIKTQNISPSSISSSSNRILNTNARSIDSRKMSQRRPR